MASMSPAQELQLFNASATERSVVLNSQKYGNGSATFGLPHAGVPTYVLVSFSGELTVSNGTTAGTITASPFWPFNIMGPSSMIDYTGTTRIYADGYDLYTLEQVKAFGSYQKNPYSQENYASNIFASTIKVPAASSTATSPINFSVVFPISYMKASALGSYAATVPDGQSYITINENPLTGSTIRSPLTLTGSTKATLAGTWSAVYYYLDTPSTVPIPVAALQQIHEVYQQQTTENLSAGSNADVVLQTGRTYYRILQRLVENNEPSLLDVARIQFLVDSSTPTLDDTLTSYYARTRLIFGRDFAPGVVIRDFTARPWSPNNYGSLTARLVLANTFSPGSFTNLWTVRETLYLPSGNLVAVGSGQ